MDTKFMRESELFDNALAADRMQVTFEAFKYHFKDDTVDAPMVREELADHIEEISDILDDMRATLFAEIKERGLIEKYFNAIS